MDSSCSSYRAPGRFMGASGDPTQRGGKASSSGRMRARPSRGPMLLRGSLVLMASAGTCAARDGPKEHVHMTPRGGDKKHFPGPGSHQTNRCSDLDMTLFDKGKVCGSPLSHPCFDYSRCDPSPGGNGLGMYVYDGDCSLADSADLSFDGTLNGKDLDSHQAGWVWRRALRDAGLLAETYESACMFIHVSVWGAKPCPPTTPLWNGGVNHVMVDFSDSNRDGRPAIANSFAMEAASNMHTCYYRAGYDISMPLVPKNVFHHLQDIAPLDRDFFLTVKGSVYLDGHGSEERMSLVPIHDESDGIISSMHCFELHDEQLLAQNVQYCETLKSRYDDHDYDSLMNTTFGLVPAGRSPGTYRLAEVMSAGAIPVFVARDIIRPFNEQFDWPSFSFVFAPSQVGDTMMNTLRAVSPERLATMQQKTIDAYWEMFGGETHDFDPMARKMLEILEQRLGHQ